MRALWKRVLGAIIWRHWGSWDVWIGCHIVGPNQHLTLHCTPLWSGVVLLITVNIGCDLYSTPRVDWWLKAFLIATFSFGKGPTSSCLVMLCSSMSCMYVTTRLVPYAPTMYIKLLSHFIILNSMFMARLYLIGTLTLVVDMYLTNSSMCTFQGLHN